MVSFDIPRPNKRDWLFDCKAEGLDISIIQLISWRNTIAGYEIEFHHKGLGYLGKIKLKR